MVNPYRSLLPATVGFDRLLSTFEELDSVFETKTSTYPPYNLFKLSDELYKIELAVAGFREEELDVTVEGNKLYVSGHKVNDSEVEYLHRGLAARDFKNTFTLADTIVVDEVKLDYGILTVTLKNVIPEEKKPRKIIINPQRLTDYVDPTPIKQQIKNSLEY
jgi:molecular chaperone IbpA